MAPFYSCPHLNKTHSAHCFFALHCCPLFELVGEFIVIRDERSWRPFGLAIFKKNTPLISKFDTFRLRNCVLSLTKNETTQMI